MSKTFRRLLYISFFLLFFVLTPLFISYALGYRYNFNTSKIEKIGAFYIKSYPKGANIYINDLKNNNKTPSQVTNLRPGEYLVSVSKENYEPWQKNLKLYPGETTFVEDIVLWLQNRTKTSLGTGSDNVLLNQANDKYAYLDNNNDLYITNVEEGKNLLIFDFNTPYSLIDWSSDNQQLLLQDNLYYYIFDINQKKLNRLNIGLVDKIIWDNNDANILWYLQNYQLIKYNITQLTTPLTQKIDLSRKTINDFTLVNDYLIIQYSLDNTHYIDQLRKDNLELIQTINNLTLGKLEILLLNNNKLILTIGSNLYIKNQDQDLITIPVTLAALHDDRLLLSNGHEIILYNFQDNWQELIDRSSQIVSELLWHPNGSYFLNEINGQTNIVEIDSRDKRNSISILDNPLKKLYLFNKKGDKLFILTPEENFYLTIQ